jgi:sec-independent protein translocase protein TatA
MNPLARSLFILISEVLMPFGIGFGEMVLIFGVLLLVFGAKRLPEIGGAMGKSIRDFKHAISGLDGGPVDSSLPSTPAPPRIPTPTSEQAPDSAPPQA